MPVRARQALLIAILLAVPVSLTSPAVRAQPSGSNSTYCQNLFNQISTVRNLALQSRAEVVNDVIGVRQRPTNNIAQAQALSSLMSALYTGDAAHLNALVQLYIGTCVTPAAPK